MNQLKHRMWKHVKGPAVYELIGVATVSTNHDLRDMAEVVITRVGDEMHVHDATDTINIRSLVDSAHLQLDKDSRLSVGDVVAVYRDNTGRYWVRPMMEFFDGRFVMLGNDLQPLTDANSLRTEQATGPVPGYGTTTKL